MVFGQDVRPSYLKSGIPHAVEIPAPVKTMILSLSRTCEASCIKKLCPTRYGQHQQQTFHTFSNYIYQLGESLYLLLQSITVIVQLRGSKLST